LAASRIIASAGEERRQRTECRGELRVAAPAGHFTIVIARTAR